MTAAERFNEQHSPETLRRRSVRGAAATVAAQLCRFVLQFGSQVLLARLLDPAQFGLIAMAAPVLGFVQTINDLGLGQAVIQRAEITQAQISALFWISVALSTVLMLLVMLAAPLFADLYGEPEITAIVRVLGCLILAAGVTIVPTALLNREMRFMPLAVIDTACIGAGAVAGVAGALGGLGAWSLVIAQIATSLTTLVLTWVFARWRPSFPAAAPEIRAMLRFGGHLTGANLATYFSVSVDRMLVGAVAGKVQLGLYERSYRLVLLPLSQLMAPISRVATPLLSRLHGSGDRFARSYLLMVQLTLLAAVPGLLVNVILAEPIVVLVFGDHWRMAAPIFAWICFGGLASSLYASTGWLYTSQGRTREQMRANIVASGLNILSFAIGVSWGAIGVAAVSAVSFVFVQTPFLVWSATRAGAVSARAVALAVLPFGLAGIASSLVLWLSRALLASADLPAILLAEVIAYAVFAAALGVLPQGREVYRSLWRLRSDLRR